MRPSEPHSIVGVPIGWTLPLVHVGSCLWKEEGPVSLVLGSYPQSNHPGLTSPHQGMTATRNHIWGRPRSRGSESGPSEP